MAEIVIEARGLCRSYREGERSVEVLHALDLKVRAGEFIVVLGPSGSGKSTLLNLLGLMDRPTGGDVHLFGRAMMGLKADERAAERCRHIGFVFQFDSLLPEFTILENVMLPGRIARLRAPESLESLENRAQELLKNLEILGTSNRFPHQASGGERQRAALARALINRPAVILADEPTGNLDRPNGELVCTEMKELTDSLNVAVIMVTHNEHAVQYASRVIRLTEGRLEVTEVS